MKAFVEANAALWSFLSVHFGLPVQQCKDVATRVAMELATGRHGKDALKKEISRNQFHQFRTYYIQDPEGAREFFWYSIVEMFDVNHDSYLDEDEFEKLCDAMYSANEHLTDGNATEMKGGFLMGTFQLPPRDTSFCS